MVDGDRERDRETGKERYGDRERVERPERRGMGGEEK